MKQEKELYTKTEVLSLGFNDKLISELLPEPTVKQNPHYKSGSPMKLWRCEDVHRAMGSKEFIEYRDRNKGRRLGAKKAVATKISKLSKEIDAKIEAIVVQNMDHDILFSETIKDKQEWYDYQNSIRNEYIEPINIETLDEPTRYRWMVNYVRHNLTSYDEDLYSMKGKVGCHQEYYRYKKAVLDKIAEVYPFLKQECIRQYVVATSSQ